MAGRRRLEVSAGVYGLTSTTVKKKRAQQDENQERWRKAQTIALIADTLAHILGPLLGR